MRSFGILGIGTNVPGRVVTNEQLIERYQIEDKGVSKTPQGLFEVTGIWQRHYVDEENTSDLAFKAAVKTLENANVDFADIDLIIVASSSPEKFFPSTACLLQNKLNETFGTENHCRASDGLAACSGFVYELETAWHFLQSGQYHCALVVGAEVLSRTVKFAPGDWWKTFDLFGDGAGAAVIGQVSDGRGFLGFWTAADGSYADLARSDGLGTTLADIEILPQMHLNGPEVFKVAVRTMSQAVNKVCQKCQIPIAEIDWIIPHQANSRITKAIAKVLAVREDKIINEIANFGNTSTASIPLALEQAILKGQIKDGDLICFTAAGGGMTYGACLLRWGR